MEETYNITGFILDNQSFGENNSRILIFSRERGLLSLVARGTKKINSKLSGHLEPITFVEAMAVRGKQYDYIGAVSAVDCFAGIKKDLEKMESAGKIVNIFKKITGGEHPDENIFVLLKSFFEILDNYQPSAERMTDDYASLSDFFVFKLFSESGLGVELRYCVVCKKEVKPGGNKFDVGKGGVVCSRCSGGLTVSDDCVKVLRTVADLSLSETPRIKAKKEELKQIGIIVKEILQYNFG